MRIEVTQEDLRAHPSLTFEDKVAAHALTHPNGVMINALQPRDWGQIVVIWSCGCVGYCTL